MSVPCRQGFIGISTVQDFSERGPVQVIEKGRLIKMFERPKLYIYKWVLGSHFGSLIDFDQEMGQWSHMLRSGTLTSVITSGLFVYIYTHLGCLYIYMINMSGRRLCNSSR